MNGQMEVIDWIRAFNGLTALIDVGLLFGRLLLVWRKLADGQRALFVGITFMLVSSIWGNVELILQDAVLSYRSILFGIGLIFLMVYLLEPYRQFMWRQGRNPLGGYDFRSNPRQSGS